MRRRATRRRASIIRDYPAWLWNCLGFEPLDFDGSFREPDPPANPRYTGGLSGVKGSIRLIGHNQAVFRDESGGELQLVRRAGPKFRVPCWSVASLN